MHLNSGHATRLCHAIMANRLDVVRDIIETHPQLISYKYTDVPLHLPAGYTDMRFSRICCCNKCTVRNESNPDQKYCCEDTRGKWGPPDKEKLAYQKVVPWYYEESMKLYNWHWSVVKLQMTGCSFQMACCSFQMAVY